MKPNDLLDTGELAELLGVSAPSLATMRAQPERHRSIDGMPAPWRLVSSRPVWLRRDVERWMERKGNKS